MRKIIFATMMFLASTQPAFAILSPFYESVVELNILLKDPRLYDNFGSGEPILGIQKNDKGYLITGNKLQMQVNLTYSENSGVGPVKFTMDFEKPESLK